MSNNSFKHTLLLIFFLFFLPLESLSEESGQWVTIPIENFPYQKIEVTNGAKISFDSEVTLVFENDRFKLVQIVYTRNANRGTGAYRCGVPCSTDYRCWNYNYVNMAPRPHKLYFKLEDFVHPSITFWDEFGLNIVDGETTNPPCGSAHTQSLYYGPAQAFAWQCGKNEEKCTMKKGKNSGRPCN